MFVNSRKISQIGATRCVILRLECTKFAPDPAGGAYSAPTVPLAVFKEPTSKDRKREVRRRGRIRKGKGEGRVWRWREGGSVKSVKPRARKVASPSLHRL